MNNQDFRYQLDSPRITGRRQQKTTCPHCHRKHCFVRYVDTQNNCQYVDDCVGRCDHEQSCGYHYKPSEFYHDNPWKDNTTAAIPQCKKEPERPLIPIPSEYFMKSMSPKSTFWQWFTTDCLQKAGFTQDDAGTARAIRAGCMHVSSSRACCPRTSACSSASSVSTCLR